MIKTGISRIGMRLLAAALVCVVGGACSTGIPSDAVSANSEVKIYPDYNGITIPCNIAPMNFEILAEGDKYVTHFYSSDSEGFSVKGKTLDIGAKEWKAILKDAQGDTVYADVYVRSADKWTKYQPISMAVAEEVDPYISYRLLEPSYVNFETMRISERCLENFDERDIANNCLLATDETGQCINCHSYQDYNRTGNMQMHIRVSKGGTMIYRDGKACKVNLKTPSAISAGVYPSWHPTLPLIAYSQNITDQVFHSAHHNKVEVQDAASDLILYDCEANKVTVISNDSTEWETFPYWNHGGTALYYASASVKSINPDSINYYRRVNYDNIHYDLYRRSFDAESRKFGEVDTIFKASEENASAIFPRESPDGRYLLFTKGKYGTFHIWHHDADLYLMDLATGSVRPLSEVNSEDTESYHSWSSNGKWILFSSRRDDGNYTRLYLAHFGPDGIAGKPFIIPQRNPRSNITRFQSYNVPEFMVKPAQISHAQMLEVLSSDAIPAME